MRRLAVLVLLAAAGCGGSPAPSKPPAVPAAASGEPVAEAPCRPARVRHTPYPGGDERLSSIPWLRGEPRELGLVGLLWYWPEEWQDVRRARVFTGGVAPAGYSAKVLWAFLSRDVFDKAGGELVIKGVNRDGPGRFRETFSEISYEGQEGAPSFASSLDLSEPGCWRLWLTSGKLRAFVDILAVPPSAVTEPPCSPERVNYDPDGSVWIDGGHGLRAHLAYWPEAWRGFTRARVYTEGRAPGGAAAKVMWVFAGSDEGGTELELRGHNLEGPGDVRDSFAEVSYEGQEGASYASVVDLPHPGCWRLTVETDDLRGTVDITAVEP